MNYLLFQSDWQSLKYLAKLLFHSSAERVSLKSSRSTLSPSMQHLKPIQKRWNTRQGGAHNSHYMRYCVHRAHNTQCADCLTNPELNAFSIISLISLIFLARCPSFRLDTLAFGITFRVASCLFLNPSISSISLISLLLCIFTSTRGLTETYLVGVRSGASMFETGWSGILDIHWIKPYFLLFQYILSLSR